MALTREDMASLQAAFRADATAAAFVDADARLLVLSGDGRRVVHAGEAVFPLACAITDDHGLVFPDHPAAERLQQLARGLAPRRGSRLERLSFLPDAATAALCRTVTLPGLGALLVCALVEPIPAPTLRAVPTPAPAEEPQPDPELPQEAPPETAPAVEGPFVAQEFTETSDAAPLSEAPEPEPLPVEPVLEEPAPDILGDLRGKGVVRFLWQADPATRFVKVSDALAETLGAPAADVIGRTWSDLSDNRIEDPSGIIADILSRRETWSGRTVWWRVDDTHAVPVDLAGMPVLDATRALVGYRGFGLIRADAAEVRPLRPPPPPAPPLPGGASEAWAEWERALIEDPLERRDTQDSPLEDIAEAQEPVEPLEETLDARWSDRDGDDADLVEADLDDSELTAPEEIGARPAMFAPTAPPDDLEMEALLDVPDEVSEPHEVAEQAPAAMFDDPAPEPPTEEAPTGYGPPTEGAPTEDARKSQQAPVADEPLDMVAAWDADAALDAGWTPAAVAADAAEPADLQAPPVASGDAPAPPALTPPAAANDAPADSVFALSGMVRARFGEATPPPLRVVETPAEGTAPSGRPPVPRLTMSERSAFREIAKALGARFEDDAAELPPAPEIVGDTAPEAVPEKAEPVSRAAEPIPIVPVGGELPRLVERLPIGVLVHRGEVPLLVNRALREMTGYDSLDDLVECGGLARIFHGRAGALARAEHDVASPMAIGTKRGESIPAEVRLTTVDWSGAPASLMLIRRVPDADPGLKLRALELDLRSRDARLRELAAILDTATDGVIVLDDVGRILSLNRSAEALFGYDQNEVTGESVTILLDTGSHALALDYLEGLRANGVASLLNDGREVVGRVRQGGSIPLFMTMGKITEGAGPKYCAVLRDITAFKKAEGELIAAKRAAEEASAQKSDFLAKISHEIRTPLNAIIGFAEVMLEERFGPVGSDRYRDYLRDIHSSGEHVISLVNDLLDLAKVEAGRMELSFTGVALNDLVTNCVALLQPQAARERIVMRTSFAAKVPPVVADERSLRQIVLNLVSNAIKFTDAGGQVIVSTAMTDRGEVAFRVRDTGIGMSAPEIEAALEPFRQLATARKGGGTGLGLPLTKALVEANRGDLQISSTKGEGTLVEVLFPPTRVLAE